LKALSRYLSNWIPFQATSLQWRDCLRLMQSLFITPVQGKNKIWETVPLRWRDTVSLASLADHDIILLWVTPPLVPKLRKNNSCFCAQSSKLDSDMTL
jgi:hypothetical protein